MQRELYPLFGFKEDNKLDTSLQNYPGLNRTCNMDRNEVCLGNEYHFEMSMPYL